MTSPRHLTYSTMMLCLAGAIPTARAESTDPVAPVALSLTLVRDHQPIQATCVLVRRDVREPDIVLYFVTAGHLFKSPEGDALSYPQSITVNVSPTVGLAVRPADVSLPHGDLVDVAVFQITLRDTALRPPSLTLVAPSARDAFTVLGFDLSGRPQQSPQHVSRVATLALIGDRPLSGLVGCAGAPVVAERAVFGFVGKCGPYERPVIVPFAAIASWINRYVPGGLMLRQALMSRLQYR
jgi:hypothetical protein